MIALRRELADARNALQAAGFAAGWSAINAVPPALSSRGFTAFADRATARNGAGVRQLRRNLRRVLGPAATEAELESAVAAGMRSYARYWLETFRLPKMDKQDVADRTHANTVGHEHVAAALATGTGYIMALPHMGNYDAAGVWAISRFGSFTTVAERLKPESLFDRFLDYRRSLGMEVLALSGGEAPPVSILTQRLREGRGVCLVADRDLTNGGVEVDFFGARARMPGGPALLSAMTGAHLLPVGIWFRGDGAWGQRIGPPIQIPDGKLRDRVRVGTQLLADQFAAVISAHPSDWHMLQKLWIDDLPYSGA